MAAALLSAPPVLAGERARFIVDEENDTFVSSNDRDFTQGIGFSYVSGDIASDSGWNAPFDAIGSVLPFLDGTGKRQFRVTLGQNIYTPTDIDTYSPDPKDRPYAGWLYGGVGLMQESGGNRLDSAELLLGVVGPAALARQAQNGFHKIIRVNRANGWDHQLDNEPGLLLSLERKWRLSLLPTGGVVGADIVPELGVSLGNVMTYAQTGAVFRFGGNLETDYGPLHIRPGQSGAGWFDSDRLNGRLGWYVFGGGVARAVAHNIFLDGSTFADSPSVDKKPVVTDIVLGASLFWADDIRLDFTATQRSREFYGQDDHDRFGMISLSLGL